MLKMCQLPIFIWLSLLHLRRRGFKGRRASFDFWRMTRTALIYMIFSTHCRVGRPMYYEAKCHKSFLCLVLIVNKNNYNSAQSSHFESIDFSISLFEFPKSFALAALITSNHCSFSLSQSILGFRIRAALLYTPRDSKYIVASSFSDWMVLTNKTITTCIRCFRVLLTFTILSKWWWLHFLFSCAFLNTFSRLFLGFLFWFRRRRRSISATLLWWFPWRFLLTTHARNIRVHIHSIYDAYSHFPVTAYSILATPEKKIQSSIQSTILGPTIYLCLTVITVKDEDYVAHSYSHNVLRQHKISSNNNIKRDHSIWYR